MRRFLPKNQIKSNQSKKSKKKYNIFSLEEGENLSDQEESRATKQARLSSKCLRRETETVRQVSSRLKAQKSQRQSQNPKKPTLLGKFALVSGAAATQQGQTTLS